MPPTYLAVVICELAILDFAHALAHSLPTRCQAAVALDKSVISTPSFCVCVQTDRPATAVVGQRKFCLAVVFETPITQGIAALEDANIAIHQRLIRFANYPRVELETACIRVL